MTMKSFTHMSGEELMEAYDSLVQQLRNAGNEESLKPVLATKNNVRKELVSRLSSTAKKSYVANPTPTADSIQSINVKEWIEAKDYTEEMLIDAHKEGIHETMYMIQDDFHDFRFMYGSIGSARKVMEVWNWVFLSRDKKIAGLHRLYCVIQSVQEEGQEEVEELLRQLKQVFWTEWDALNEEDKQYFRQNEVDDADIERNPLKY